MMVVDKQDLGLTLSLASTNPPPPPNTTTNNNNNNNNNHMNFFTLMNSNNNNNNNETTPFSSNPTPTLQLNLMTSPTYGSSNFTPPFLHNNLPWAPTSTHSFPPSDVNSDTCRSKGIDVNRPTRGSDGEEEEAGVSSPYSTVSTMSGGKRSSGERDSAGPSEEADVERMSSHGGGGGSDDEDGGENSRKKLRLTKDQSATLEESFKEHSTLNPKQKQALAKRLGLRPRQVEVWFQNRRARTKLKQTEVDCEFLKGCCEKLTEENRRLQKEVLELRTLKMSPQFYMHMTPPTTLTMCPSCERVVGPTSSVTAHNFPVSRPNHRPAPMNLWARSPVSLPVRPFEAIQPRS